MSKYQKYADDGTFIYPHRHCVKCNRICDEDQEYCSEECRTAATYKTKRSKKSTIIQIAVMGGVIAVFIIIMLVMQKPA